MPCGLVSCGGNLWRARREKLLFLELDALPRRIGEHGVEPAVLHDLSEHEVPVEEAMPIRQPARLRLHTGPRHLAGASPPHIVRDGDRLARAVRLGREERPHEQIGLEFLPGAGFVPTGRLPRGALAFHLFESLLGHRVQIDGGHRDLQHSLLIEQVPLTALAVPRLEVPAHALVVAR